MKKFCLPILMLAILFSATLVSGKNDFEKSTKSKIELVAEKPVQIKLQIKEAYKLDDAEYKTAVPTKADFSNQVSHAGMGFFSWLIMITSLFRSRKQAAKIAALGLGLFVAGLIFNDQSSSALAVLPLVPFFRDKANEDGGGATAKEIKDMLEAASKEHGEATKKEITKAIGDATKGLLTSEQLTEKFEKLGLKDGLIKELNDAVEKQGLELNKIINGGGRNIVKTIDEIMKEQAEGLKGLSDGNGKTLKFRVNADGVNKTIVNSTSLTGSSLSYREQGIGQLAAPNTVFDKVFRTVNLSEADLKASNGVITYMDVTAETNNAAETAEHAAAVVGVGNKPESAITWQEYSASLRVIADTIPVTRNSYRHLGFIGSELERLLRKNQAQRKDTQIYKGDGVAPNIKGIYTFTTAVVLANMPSYAALTDPNLYDLIANLRVYVANKSDASGAQSKYMPNVVFMNPSDILKYKLKKAVDGHYILPPFVSADGTRIDGCLVVESPKVVVGTMMVGDSSYGTIYQSEDVVIEMGLVNDQFLKNQWTIRAEQELCFLQRNADLGAFVKVTDIDAAIAALVKV